jgi:hypothetical protein
VERPPVHVVKTAPRLAHLAAGLQPVEVGFDQDGRDGADDFAVGGRFADAGGARDDQQRLRPEAARLAAGRARDGPVVVIDGKVSTRGGT